MTFSRAFFIRLGIISNCSSIALIVRVLLVRGSLVIDEFVPWQMLFLWWLRPVAVNEWTVIYGFLCLRYGWDLWSYFPPSSPIYLLLLATLTILFDSSSAISKAAAWSLKLVLRNFLPNYQLVRLPSLPSQSTHYLWPFLIFWKKSPSLKAYIKFYRFFFVHYWVPYEETTPTFWADLWLNRFILLFCWACGGCSVYCWDSVFWNWNHGTSMLL